ncbi:MAG: GAF domain-containing protein [Cytophagales bacterium]|nr:GAF domain-containing protein [Cytophagales bacterium]
MKGIRFTIRRKIIWGFLALIIIFSGNAAYSVYTIYKGNAIIEQSQEVINPITEAVNDLIFLATRSKMLTTNWVYLQTNDDDKVALRAIHDHEYLEVKNRILQHSKGIDYGDDIVDLDSAFFKFEALLDIEKGIMTELASFEDYEDPIKKFMAEESIESEVLPRSAELILILENLNKYLSTQKSETDAGLMGNFKQLINVTATLAVILLVIGLVLAFSISRAITGPITYLRAIIDRLGKGDLVKIEKNNVSNDEIGDMATSLSSMAEGFGEITVFAKNIGDGKYDSEFKPLSESDMLGNALLEMRSNLKKVAEEDKKRNWTTSGLAKFGDILRSYNDNFEKLTDEIISNLVKYIQANQGALFIVESNNAASEDEYMEMVACYAWDKKKFLEKKIYRGEGLSGQAWLEGDIIYLTEVPDEYVSITSGLGEANPRSILIVPLKLNDEIHGVIEMASFKEYEEFEIEFVSRIAENIASTISSVKVNEQTSRLLEESTMMTEQMRAQEEEMRQNMEELQATQEKIQRDQVDRESRERIVLSGTVLFELNKSFVVRSANEICKEVFKYSPAELEGRMFKDLMVSSSDLSMIKENATTDTYWNGVIKMKDRNGARVELLVSAGQVPDSINNDSMYVIYGKNITGLVSA